MATDQEREFELVLGNKQLFSVLFIVIVLFAAFFSMGYVMGRNSGPAEVAQNPPVDSYSKADTSRRSPIPPQTEASTRTPAAEVQTSPRASASDTPATSEAAPQTAAGAVAASRKPIEVPSVSVTEPQAGRTYWQVSAVAKPEAELLVEVLTKKGFHSLVAPGPNEKLFRVLVGPARDQADLGKLRSELEQAGFKPMIRKY